MSSLHDRLLTLAEMQLPPGYKSWAEYGAAKKAGKLKKGKPSPHKPSRAPHKPSPLAHLNPNYGEDRLPKDVFKELQGWSDARTITPENFIDRLTRSMRKGALRATRRFIKNSPVNREKVATLGLKALKAKKSAGSFKSVFDKLAKGDPHSGDDWGDE